MNLEEAIKNREDCLKYLERIGQKAIPDCVEAVRWSAKALKALRPVSRERVEKVWRGEWRYYPEDYDELTWTCSRCGEPWTLIDGTPDDNNMDFCPACGAPMTDKAVQMVMERLEDMLSKE